MFDKLKKKLDKAIHGDDDNGAGDTKADGVGNEAATKQVSKKRTPFAFNYHDNDYQWPSLYEEADEMLQLSLLIYTITDLRSLAKKPKLAKKLQDPEKILKLPLSLAVFLQVLEENLDFIKSQVGDDDHQMTMSALSSIQERIDRLKITSTSSSSSSKAASTTTTTGVSSIFQQWFQPLMEAETGSSQKSVEVHDISPYLVQYGDEKPDSDLVYGIGIDPIRKRVTVVFRGSVTPNDFLIDSSIALKVLSNPVKGLETDLENEEDRTTYKQSDDIAIHQGFYDYLLKERKETPGRSKFDEIWDHVMEIFDENNGEKFASYKLYVSGHSLGGALSTLFGFYAASKIAATKAATGNKTKILIPLPITVVSVASPRCGEGFFQHAFRLLERRGDLRHLRVVNDRDPVTIMPKSSTKKIWAMLSPISYLAFKLADSDFDEKETYRHTGIKLKLKLKKDGDEEGTTKKEEDEEKTEKKKGSTVTYQLAYTGTSQVFEATLDESAATAGESSSAERGAKDRSIGSVTQPKKKMSKKISTEDIPDVVYHMGNMYVNNLLGVKTTLTSKKLTLNGLYKQIN